MKKIFLKSLTCLLFLTTMISCSTDSVTQEQSNQTSRDNLNKKGGSIWEGVIGVERDGQYVITADKEALMSYLEYLVKQDGDIVEFDTISIEKLTATNDPTNTAFMLITNGRIGGIPGTISTSIILTKGQFGFYLGTGVSGDGDPITVTSCKGCSYGCNLRYYTIGKNQVPYCDENGCSRYNCTKRERPL